MIGRDLADLAIAKDSRRRRAEKGEGVEKAFSAELLEHPYQHVREGGETEQAVLPIAEEQEHYRTSADDRIEQGEQVGAKDMPEAPTGSRREGIGHVGADSSRHLAVIQPANSQLCEIQRRECGPAGSGRRLRV